MALIPGSYARAAGLQSEINKVTVTRVAGSEVQFRRAIDTYQRDLRYQVNSIQREQKQLRRSMKRYYKKLRDSKKEREQRKEQLKDRKNKGADRTRPADSQILRLPGIEHSHGDVTMAGSVDSNPLVHAATGAINSTGGCMHNGVKPASNQGDLVPDSPDSGIGVDTDSEVLSQVDLCNESIASAKAFMTSNKSKPYFKAKRGHENVKPGTNAKKGCQPEHADDAEPELPAIAEEGEEDGGQGKNNSGKVTFDIPVEFKKDNDTAGVTDPNSGDRIEDAQEADKTAKTKAAVHPIFVASLNTKHLTQTASSNQQDSSDVSNRVHSEGLSRSDTALAAMTTRKKSVRRKTGVSFGDLIKLQHTPTSSTKHLFDLVDRLASKHGIVDPPPDTQATVSSSLDPRSNVRIRRRSRGLESQSSDGIVKHAAVLYSMKYGYHVPEELLPELVQSQVMHNELDDERDGEGFMGFLSSALSPHSPSVDRGEYVLNSSDAAEFATSRLESSDNAVSRKNSNAVSIRLDSRGIVVSTHMSSDVESSLVPEDNNVIHAGAAHLPDSLESRASRSRSRQRQRVSISELSEHVSRIKSMSLRASDPDPDSLLSPSSRSQSTSRAINLKAPTDHKSSQPSQKLSPLPQRSHSLSRSRRESVSSQIQQRLNDHGDKGVAWQSAFGRLKMVHTLVDLASYFHKD